MDLNKALLSKEQWDSWHRSDESAAFRDFLRASIAEAKQAWAQGAFTDGKDAFQSAVANAAAVENIRVVQQLIDMEYADYLTQMKDD